MPLRIMEEYVMKKNLLLAFILLLATFGLKAANAKEFQQPSWQSDYQVEDKAMEDNGGVRLPSSGSQSQYHKPSGESESSDVEAWKFEPSEQEQE